MHVQENIIHDGLKRRSQTTEMRRINIEGITGQHFVNQKRNQQTGIESGLMTMRTIKTRTLNLSTRNL